MNDRVPPPANGGNGDLSDDDVTVDPRLAGKVEHGLFLVAQDVKVVRRMHYGVVFATAVPVGILLWLLWCMVSAFSAHVSHANDFLTEVINAKPVAATATNGAVALPVPTKIKLTPQKDASTKGEADKKDASHEKSKDEGDVQLSDQAHLYKLISSYETNVSTSSVAMVSILVIAIVVITVAILRSALALVPYDPSKKADSETKEAETDLAKAGEYAVPIVEFGKRLKELFQPFFEKKS